MRCYYEKAAYRGRLPERFCKRKSWLPQSGDAGICNRGKIKQYRREGAQVVFTFDTHETDYLETQEGKNLPVPHCIRGSDGWRLYGAVAEQRREEDRCLEKDTFGSLELAKYLAECTFDRIELVGVVSNICVISNAVLAKAAQPEALVVVDAACTASNDDALHEKALDVMESFQICVYNREKNTQ